MNDCRQYHADKKSDQLESFTCRKTSAPAFISVSGTASRLKHVMQKR